MVPTSSFALGEFSQRSLSLQHMLRLLNKSRSCIPWIFFKLPLLCCISARLFVLLSLRAETQFPSSTSSPRAKPTDQSQVLSPTDLKKTTTKNSQNQASLVFNTKGYRDLSSHCGSPKPGVPGMGLCFSSLSVP